MNTRIQSIDVLRLWAAFLVVSIHCWFFAGRAFVLPYARIAVPLFLLISGYFIFSKEKENACIKIDRSLKKIGRIWLIGTFFFCIDCFYKCYTKGNFSLFEPTWQTPFIWAIFCHQKIGFPLWFLVAMAEGLLMMKLLIKKHWTQIPQGIWQWVIPCLLLTVGVFLNKYLCHFYPIFGNHELQYPPCIFMSWPYLFLGYLIRKNQTRIVFFIQTHQLYLWTLIFVTLLLTFIEGRIVPSDGDSYLCTLPLSLAIFLLILHYPNAGDKRQATLGRKYSLYIYVFHVIVYSCIQRLLGTYNHWLLHPLIIFTITLLLSWMIGVCLTRVKNSNNIKTFLFS